MIKRLFALIGTRAFGVALALYVLTAVPTAAIYPEYFDGTVAFTCMVISGSLLLGLRHINRKYINKLA